MFIKGYKVSKETRQKMAIAKKGISFTLEHRKNISDAKKGEKHPRWKGGVIEGLGYFLQKEPSHPSANVNGYVLQHRLIVEKSIGRYLKVRELVHHIDENRKNNNLDNLFLFRHQAAHNRWHRFLERHALNGKILESNLTGLYVTT